MSAAVSGSPSRSEQQQQSLEDAWSCQLALLRPQHTLFCHDQHNHHCEQIAATYFQHDCNSSNSSSSSSHKTAACTAYTWGCPYLTPACPRSLACRHSCRHSCKKWRQRVCMSGGETSLPRQGAALLHKQSQLD